MYDIFDSTLLANLILLAGGLYGLYEWRWSVKVRRAEFISQLHAKFFDGDAFEHFQFVDSTMVYDREAGRYIQRERWYDEHFHDYHVGRIAEMEKLFTTLSYFCYLYNHECITDAEFACIKYYVDKVCLSPDGQTYLWNVHHHQRCIGKANPYHELTEYGLAAGIIPAAFRHTDAGYWRRLFVTEEYHEQNKRNPGAGQGRPPKKEACKPSGSTGDPLPASVSSARVREATRTAKPGKRVKKRAKPRGQTRVPGKKRKRVRNGR